MKRSWFRHAPGRWQDQLGPFGRHRSTIAFATLLVFVSTTLRSSLAWAEGGPRTEPARQALDPAQLQDVSRAPVTIAEQPASLRESTAPDRPRTAASLSPAELRPAAASTGNAPSIASSGGTHDAIADATVALANLPKAGAPIAAQAISVPSGAATVSGMGESFTAQLTTGIATFNVPISIPRARGGAQPSLNLVYSSSGGFGNAGVGWSLAGTIAIARQTDRGTPSYDDRNDFHPKQDRFTFGGQELVPICTVTDGACSGALADEIFPEWSEGYQYLRSRIEGAFLRFFWSPDHRTWRIQSKDGLHLELGVPLSDSSDTNGIEAGGTNPNEIYRWHVVRQYDSRGEPDAVPEPLPNNIVVYRYREDAGVRFLSDVYYTPPASAPRTGDLSLFAHHVHIEWQARPDRISSYRAGFLQMQRLRLAHVDISSKPFDNALDSPRQLVRRYHTTYEAGLHTSLLASIQFEGRCETPIAETPSGSLPSSNCPRLPPLAFGYQRVAANADSAIEDAAGLAFEPFDAHVQDLGDASPPHSLDEQRVALMDIDSDSLPDLLVTAPGLYQGKHGLFLNGRAGNVGFGAAQGMGVSGVSDVDANVLSLTNANVAPLDPDGDALINLVHMPAVKKYSVFTPQKQGSVFSWVGRSIATAADQDPKIDFARDAPRIARADVNADGLVDLVFTSATELQTFFSLGQLPGGDTQFGHGELTSSTTATLSTDPVRTCLPWSAQPIRFDDPEVRITDMNGDGLPDIVRLRAGQLLYWPGRGNGYFGTGERNDCEGGSFGQDRHVLVANAPQFGTAINGGLELGDVNGDGLADLVEFRANAVDIYLNENGERFTDRRTLTDVPFKPATSRYVQLTDLDGTGTPDLVWGRAYEYRYIDLAGGMRPYLLTRIENGLGKLTEFEYASSTQLMLAARKAGTPWKRDLPMATPVVVRSIVRDQLEKVGRAAGEYVIEYAYREPLFDGSQREFRGFEVAESHVLGDANSPSVTTRSTFLLGQCEVAQDGFDACAPTDRWQDNWREPLKGLPVLVETFDDDNVYLNTAHSNYELRQLYTGRDGRRVSVAYSVGQEVFSYDTANFTPSTTTEVLDELQVNLAGISQSETRKVTRRAVAGTVRIRGGASFDDLGNPLTQVAEGCVEGCEATDEVITQHSEPMRIEDDGSGWLFRPERTFVAGSVQNERRHETRFEYDSAGDVARTFGTLSGTLPLDRTHAGGGAVAPTPGTASSGIATPVEVQAVEYARDDFGHVVGQQAAPDRCRSVVLDSAYAELPIAETTYGGEVDASTGCGTRAFTTSASYDRGLALVVASRDVRDQPIELQFDGFGRLTAKFLTDPDTPGQVAELPTVTYEYLLPDDASVAPFSIIGKHDQDGAAHVEGSYRDAYSYIDGLGRPIASLAEADPLAGDEGDFVVGGVHDYDAKGAVSRSYEPFFWVGEPLEFSLGVIPTRGFTSQQNDAFGRPIAGYGLDAQIKVFKRYHALSDDTFDALDLALGPQHGTHASTFSDGHGRTVKTIERIHVGTPALLEERLQLAEYLPTGEVTRFIQRRAGSPDVVRWMRYDSQGRLVLNVEPNTSQGFTSDSSADPSTFKAIRYAYDDLGELVATSDARGCGANYHYDAAGRILAEDYSPCQETHAPYSPPDFATRTGIETLYVYDTLEPSLSEIIDAGGTELSPDPALFHGRVVSVSDRGSRSVLRYDARGHVTGGAIQVAKPGAASDSISDRYAPRWYITEMGLDAAGRTVQASTGVTTPQLLGDDNDSLIKSTYSERGAVIERGSSYGTLSTQAKFDADGRLLSLTLGDAAATQRSLSYDTLRRLKTVQTYRAGPEIWSSPAYPMSSGETQQLSLEDTEFSYDAVNNVTAIADFRIPEEWPDSAKPVSRGFEYDDLYRLTRSTSTYPAGSDPWVSPHDAENEGRSDGPKPSPHVAFDHRLHEQRYVYDHLGNLTETTDDVGGFFDRSMGAQLHGNPAAGPHQLISAENRSVATTSARGGELETRFDAAGNLTDLLVHRDGPCLPTSASCWQRFHYGWDELGRLTSAQRWDLEGAERDDRLDATAPARTADVQLQNTYDASGARVIKTAIDPDGNASHTVYLNSTYELRRTWWSEGDYVLTPETVSVYLPGGRVVYSEEDLPSLSSGKQHLFLELSDYLGSSAATIDHETGELVEFSTYQPFGGVESDYRPARWGEFREPYKFSGKEEDTEVGLAYFGARFLVVGLNRWASPDPVTIEQLRGDLNPYAYVAGRPMVSIDPNGRELFTAIAVGFAIAFVVAGASNVAYQATTNHGKVDWGEAGIAALVGGAGGAVSGGVGFGVGSLLAGYSWGGIAASGAAGVAGSATNATLACAAAGKWDGEQIGIAAGIGLFSGVVGGGLGAGTTRAGAEWSTLTQSAGSSILAGSFAYAQGGDAKDVGFAVGSSLAGSAVSAYWQGQRVLDRKIDEIAKIIDNTGYKQVLDKVNEVFELHLRDYEYNPDLTVDAITTKSGKIMFGLDAFRNGDNVREKAGYLILTAMHEARHIWQLEHGNWAKDETLGDGVNEYEGWTVELENADRFGLSDSQINEIKSAQLREYMRLRVDPEYRTNVLKGDFTVRETERLK